MRLKEGFVLHDAGGEHMAVATGEASKIFSGLVRNNSTADFIFRQLMQETSEEMIVSAMLKKYEVSKEQAVADVHRVIEQIRKEGFLDG